ncbi:universal stress protein UspE [Psychromonas sp. 14N.309.X.WAT.B.A12]|uniref:universal stress protein UspE n=1 Tax=unclassified Psychromonas TaxID=2614957 RepID=UPI0025AF49A9|nr:universal stress protein UspE [Psychromonas sp. 14N.309.X.WAT.B.A12]MDN2662572.1 universal stress protein UspE [Psychromonas sp. 14N.309.X.WAT.B.A12]
MLKYNNILVYIDPTKEQQPALQRAIEIAQKNKSTKITLFLSCYDLTYEMTSLSSAEERQVMQSLVIKENQEWLDTLAEPYRVEGFAIGCQVHWHNRPFQAAIQLILREGYDLLIKSTHPHSRLSAILFTPTDWNLLRKCPIPLLLVKAKSWPENGNILCAIDCKSVEDETHHSLNEAILTEASDIAQMIKSNIHVVNAYPSPPMNIMMELPEFDPIHYEDGLKKFHQKTLNDYANKYQIDPGNIHLEQGLPEDVISDVAQEIKAELVILGTVGRSGLGLTLLGHTAEQVIDKLDSDLLALKPKGFISPIKIDE